MSCSWLEERYAHGQFISSAACDGVWCRYLVVHSTTAKGNAQAEAGAAVLQEQALDPSSAVCALCHDPWEV